MSNSHDAPTSPIDLDEVEAQLAEVELMLERLDAPSNTTAPSR